MSDRPELLWSQFHDYYVTHEPEWCFVAVNDADKAVGYILCAPDFGRYVKIMREEYVPKTRSLSPEHADAIEKTFIKYKEYLALYPAHLHIDILPEYQGRGLGVQLMSSLLRKLRDSDINGVFLTTGVQKEHAHKFFEKNGFKKIDSLGKDYIYAMRF